MKNPNVLIMATKKNIDTLTTNIPYIKKNISNETIFVICNKNLEQDIKQIDGVEFIDEDIVVQGMTFEAVAEIIEKRTGSKKRTGWYYQQFLKLGWALTAQDEYYVVIDADTFPLNTIEFIDSDNKYLFTQKIEYNKPYFDTLKNLFAGEIEKIVDFSFVAEHMAFDTKIVREMLAEIVKLNPNRGTTFYEIILNSIAVEDMLVSGFSEFETYGNYIATKYPNMVKPRKLRTLREATYVLGGFPTKEQLNWAARDYDIISIEVPDYPDTFFTILTKNEIIQRFVHLKTLAKARQRLRSIYRKVVGKKDMKFD